MSPLCSEEPTEDHPNCNQSKCLICLWLGFGLLQFLFFPPAAVLSDLIKSLYFILPPMCAFALLCFFVFCFFWI